MTFVTGWSRVWPESSAALICTFHFRIRDLTGMIKSLSGILFKKYSIIFFVCKFVIPFWKLYFLTFFFYICLPGKQNYIFLYLNLSNKMSEECIFAE